MAQETFGQIWNKVLLYAPGTPVPLVQQMVKNAYQRAIDMHYWSDLLADGELVVKDSYSTGTVGVTEGSTTVSSSGATWTAGHVGMQLAVDDAGGQPYYTVTATTTDAITIDRAYEGETDSSSTYVVGDYYLEFPSDLGVLDDVRELNNEWRLRRPYHQQNYLDLVDADRSQSGSPILYVAAPPRIASGVSYPRYEFWPKPPDGTHIVFRYFKTSDLTTNTSYIIPGLKPEAVVFGALAELALWPGTVERPNPFFSMDLHRTYTKLFEDAVHDSEMADLDRMQRMLIYDDESTGPPGDASWLQAHGIPF